MYCNNLAWFLGFNFGQFERDTCQLCWFGEWMAVMTVWPLLHISEGCGFWVVSSIWHRSPDRNKRNGLFPQITRKKKSTVSLIEEGSDLFQLGKEPLLLNMPFDPHALWELWQPGDATGLGSPLFRLNFPSALLTSVHEAHLWRSLRNCVLFHLPSAFLYMIWVTPQLCAWTYVGF